MPTTIIDGYRFRFYSSDANEPPHMHVIRERFVTKIWLDSLEVAYNRGYSTTELNRIIRLTGENQEKLLEAWYGHFG
ncbi:MAG: DUF4160 domain-containing protein [Caldilineaceae bacterium]|nr:DUF4160 domain-containing protein [Caldilineaceae bacterium]